MLFEVFLHTLQELRQSLLIWGLGLVVYGLLAALLYPLISLYPIPGFVSWLGMLVGVPDGMASAERWLNLMGFALVFPLILSSFTIWAGSRLIAVDEQNGSLETLLAYPISRWRLVVEKFAALAAGVILLSFSLWLVLDLVNFALGLKIAVAHLAGACLGLALLSLLYGSLANFIASRSGRANDARLLTWTIFLITYLLSAVWLHGLAPLRWLSPFHYAASLPPFDAGIPWLHVLVLLALIGLSINAAYRVFEQRDLAV
jgi:ABC-2 type transport system permease protein